MEQRDDRHLPRWPTQLRRPFVFYALRRTIREFRQDDCMDLAAALTYYGVLSIFPAVLVMVSLLGVLGQGERTTNSVLNILGQLVPPSVVDTLRGPVHALVVNPSAGVALGIGLAFALWSASRYARAFGRAMNQIYGIEEGRPIWRRLPMQVFVTLVGLIFAAAEALMLALSGPIAKHIGALVGAGDQALTIWSFVRWPVVLLLAMATVAVLYYATPNLRKPRFRWTGVGATVAVLTWAVASYLLQLYAVNFGRFNQTYGALAGLIVFLLWLWITNLALLLGAELDAELERARQLQAGIQAERRLQLAVRVEADDATGGRVIERAKRLRGAEESSGDSPF